MLGDETWVTPSITSWAQVIFTIVVVPSVVWLVASILKLRLRIVSLEEKIAVINKNCVRHQESEKDIIRLLNRVNKNVGRLCITEGITEVDE